MSSNSRVIVLVAGLLLLLVGSASGQGLVASEQAKFIASDGAAFDSFGASVAISGDTAIVGAGADDHGGGTDAGAAYVFVRTGTSWTEQAKLTASDAAAGDGFGSRVGISGNTAIVTAPGDSHGQPNAGSAYVFVRTGTSWSQQAKLVASDFASNDFWGSSVAISGDTAIVGSLFDTHSSVTTAGSAYVFVRSGTTWGQQAKLTASDVATGHGFGVDVALSGDTVVVGASSDSHAGTDAGAAYVFVRSGTSWSQQVKLTASDAAASHEFGISVALSGNTAVVGAFLDDHSGTLTGAGSAYVFTRAGTSWSQEAKIAASDAAAHLNFGRGVTIADDTAVVGAPNPSGTGTGAGYVFVRTGTAWVEQTKLVASDGVSNDFFGAAVALSSDTVVAGASAVEAAYSFHLYSCSGSVVQYGSACTGSSGSPTLSARGCSAPGEVIVIDMASAASNAPALLLLGTGSGTAAINSNCDLQILPLLSTTIPFVFPSTGAITFSAILPPALPVPLNVHLQTLIDDPGATGGVAATNPIQLQIQ